MTKVVSPVLTTLVSSTGSPGNIEVSNFITFNTACSVQPTCTITAKDATHITSSTLTTSPWQWPITPVTQTKGWNTTVTVECTYGTDHVMTVTSNAGLVKMPYGGANEAVAKPTAAVAQVYSDSTTKPAVLYTMSALYTNYETVNFLDQVCTVACSASPCMAVVNPSTSSAYPSLSLKNNSVVKGQKVEATMTCNGVASTQVTLEQTACTASITMASFSPPTQYYFTTEATKGGKVVVAKASDMFDNYHCHTSTCTIKSKPFLKTDKRAGALTYDDSTGEVSYTMSTALSVGMKVTATLTCTQAGTDSATKKPFAAVASDITYTLNKCMPATHSEASAYVSTSGTTQSDTTTINGSSTGTK